MKLLLPLACFVVFCAPAQGDPELRSKYGPYPEKGFPQIIQADDYATIEFIESLCRNLADISQSRDEPEEFGRAVGFTIKPNSLQFRSLRDPKSSIIVRRNDSNTITIQEVRFGGRPTTVLYSTLFHILSDYTEKGACREVRFVQYGTRTYKKRSIIEFDFGEQVVVVDSLSNGPKEGERLYVLDIVPRKDSMFWSRKRA